MAFSAICETCGQPYYLGMEETPHKCLGPKVFPQAKDHQELTDILTVATAPRLSAAERQKKWRQAHKAQAVAEATARRANAKA